MKKNRIAVVGSGISGLSAALFLSKNFEVHLFEKNKILGGHTRTINFLEDNKNLSIDTGFIVFNEKNYPDLVSFFKFLDVPIENSNMSFSVSNKYPDLEYGGSNLNTLFAQRKNIFSFRFFHLIFEILKLYNKCKKLKSKSMQLENHTIEEFLIKNNFSENLRKFHIYPMISSIWSTNNSDVKNFPLSSFIEFFSNHGLFDLKNRPQWKFVKDGSYNYIDKLIKKNLFNFHTNFKVKKILRKNEKIQIFNNMNEIFNFDKVVIATHANQALELLDSSTKEEKKILSFFEYTKNTAFLHTDENFMPRRKSAWSSWNFLKFNNKDDFTLTYWMNKLQNISSETNYFVTINPFFYPKNIIDKTIFEHPIFNTLTNKAQKELYKIQGIKNTFYCGSYCSYGFHEDGIQSAAYIADFLNIDLPWIRNKNYNNRLKY